MSVTCHCCGQSIPQGSELYIPLNRTQAYWRGKQTDLPPAEVRVFAEFLSKGSLTVSEMCEAISHIAIAPSAYARISRLRRAFRDYRMPYSLARVNKNMWKLTYHG